jgi:hypothetical protein
MQFPAQYHHRGSDDHHRAAQPRRRRLARSLRGHRRDQPAHRTRRAALRDQAPPPDAHRLERALLLPGRWRNGRQPRRGEPRATRPGLCRGVDRWRPRQHRQQHAAGGQLPVRLRPAGAQRLRLQRARAGGKRRPSHHEEVLPQKAEVLLLRRMLGRRA